MDGFVTVNGHKVHYVEYGSGKPVFNIHGYEVDHRMMTGALDLTNKYEDKPAGIARDSRIQEAEEVEE